MISQDLAEVGVSKTEGTFINKMIDKYKNSEHFFIYKIIPNKLYCLTGYWIELFKPGIFESMIYEKSKKKFNEYKNINNDLKEFLKDLKKEYKNLKM